MSVAYVFKCDVCGKMDSGVWSEFLEHPLPPLGWRWAWGSGLKSPHTCSIKCWQSVRVTENGKVRLYASHETESFMSESLQTTEPVPLKRTSRKPESVVYYIQRGDSGPVKIGITQNVQVRLRSLQSASAEPLFVRKTVPGSRDVERKLHDAFRVYRLNGEWFAPEVLTQEAACLGSD